MEKRKFSLPERYAVWKTLGPLCSWCREPVEFRQCQIDHVIPESLLEDPAELAKTLEQYGLDTDFDINSFYNWVPTHPSCNQTKQASVMTGAPVFLALFELTAKAFPETKALHDKWASEKKIAKLLAMIEKEALANHIDEQTISQIFRGINDRLEPVMGLTGSTIDNRVFYVPSTATWQVTGTKDDHYLVEKDGKTGIAPISGTPDPDWLCTSCMNYGPWNGNQCLNCGQYGL